MENKYTVETKETSNIVKTESKHENDVRKEG